MKKENVKIGLEIHIPLNTKSKLFCSCPTAPSSPNSNVCEICLGLPGSKPALNKSAVSKAIKLALALNCDIKKQIIFARKTYFYPDLPKNYQITQYEDPIAANGFLEIANKKISFQRLQLEEDPGSLYHKENCALVDYNRAGIPLIELVTSPEFETSNEVIEFVTNLTAILDYLEIRSPSEYAIRTDINISIGKNSRTEIKNVSGAKNIEKAINFELIRQKLLLKKGEKIERKTLHFDSETEKTFVAREKESEEDYGYIYEPDLSVIELTSSEIEEIKKQIPELPKQKIARFKKQFSLKDEEAYVIALEKSTADLYESLYNKVNKKLLKNWIIVTLRKVLNFNKKRFSDTKISEHQVEDLLNKISSGELTPRAAEFVLRELVKKPDEIKNIIKKIGLKDIDKPELNELIKKIIEENKESVKDFQEGKEKALHFLVGQIIRKTKGKADAKDVAILIKNQIKDKFKNS